MMLLGNSNEGFFCLSNFELRKNGSLRILACLLQHNAVVNEIVFLIPVLKSLSEMRIRFEKHESDDYSLVIIFIW